MAARPSPMILITRPEPSARTLKKMLEAKGYEALIEPLLKIEPLRPMAPLRGNVQGIALTSANAVSALREEAKRLPIFAVGKATADAARKAGCDHVMSGDGDGAALAELIAGTCSPSDGAILHLAGEVVREDFHLGLEAKGFHIKREVVYRARPAAAFSEELLRAWRSHKVSAVLLFSPRTAEILVRLLIEHDLADQVDRTTAICVSEATATPCRELVWREICLALEPNQDAMIRSLEGSIDIC